MSAENVLTENEQLRRKLSVTTRRANLYKSRLRAAQDAMAESCFVDQGGIDLGIKAMHAAYSTLAQAVDRNRQETQLLRERVRELEAGEVDRLRADIERLRVYIDELEGRRQRSGWKMLDHAFCAFDDRDDDEAGAIDATSSAYQQMRKQNRFVAVRPK
jgi:hypothetical protein